MIVPVEVLHPTIVSIGVLMSVSCEVKVIVIVFPIFAYPELVVLLELKVVVPVRYGFSLSICICGEVCITSVFPNVSTE